MILSARRPCRSLCALALLTSVGVVPSPAADTGFRFTPTTRLLVQTKAGADAGRVVTDAVRRARARRIRLRRIQGANVHVLDVAAAHVGSIEAALASDTRVRFVERDRVVPPAQLASDAGTLPADHLPLIGAPWAWRFTAGSAAAPIAILDSGVDASHPDLAERVLPGWNVHDGSDDTRDLVGHGTLVAGIVAAAPRDTVGVSGVAHAAPILPVRVTDEDGNAYHSTLTEGLVWAADHGARVANISFAIFGGQALSSAAQYFVNRGGLVFAAGGNDGRRHNDAANDWIVSVAATSSVDGHARFSSSGPYIDLAAPGVGLMSTALGGTYALVSGTSAASPVAAGVAALAWSANPSLRAGQVEEVLRAYSEDLGEPGYDPVFGWGRVDAARAVAVALWLGRTSDPIVPRSRIVSPTGGQVVRETVGVTIAATDNVGVVGVELLVDGRPLATSETEPHTFVWDSSGVGNGPHTLVARARDAAANVGTSAPVTIMVDNSRPVRPPRVRVRVPSAAALSGTIPVGVRARGAAPIVAIELYVDGALVTIDGGRSLRALHFAWDTRDWPDGSHTIYAIARDATGHAASSRPVSVQIRNAS